MLLTLLFTGALATLTTARVVSPMSGTSRNSTAPLRNSTSHNITLMNKSDDDPLWKTCNINYPGMSPVDTCPTGYFCDDIYKGVCQNCPEVAVVML